ncbi:MAG TPA: TlpA disulfide reductase family protein [Bacteroidia bacterium]
MKLIVVILLFVLSVAGFAQYPKKGIWQGKLVLNEQENIVLPFNFETKVLGKRQLIFIHNAEERIKVDEVTIKKDSVNFKMPVFDSEFKTKNYGDSLVGVWINHSRKDKNIIPFRAYFGKTNRFDFPPGKPYSFYEGKWETTFSPGTADSSKAIGVFKQGGSVYASGTFLTETGDYRYLDGMQHKGDLYLSCFDGSHAFLFIGRSDGTSITDGDFYSGSHWHEKWIAKRNDNFELQPAETITKLNPGFETVSFTFNNADKKPVSINDAKYKNKVIIIQLMGSWCPNCMDETAYLSEIYKKYNPKGLEIIGLAYERTNDWNKAVSNVNRLKKRFGVGYEILITGLTGKEKASESLPMLSKISAFPTTLFIDKKGKVQRIHTGFSGPATGEAYEKFKNETEKLLEELLNQ